jgi:hypothetical protein
MFLSHEDIVPALSRLSRWLFLRVDTKCKISTNSYIASSRDERPIRARGVKYAWWPGYVFPALLELYLILFAF